MFAAIILHVFDIEVIWQPFNFWLTFPWIWGQNSNHKNILMGLTPLKMKILWYFQTRKWMSCKCHLNWYLNWFNIIYSHFTMDRHMKLNGFTVLYSTSYGWSMTIWPIGLHMQLILVDNNAKIAYFLILVKLFWLIVLYVNITYCLNRPTSVILN